MSDDEARALATVVSFLRREHANERAAALAYRGHARSVRDRAEREHLERVEREEWHHREVLEQLLRDLGSAPNPWIERPLSAVGWVFGVLCFVTGWLAPMIGAGWIERINAQNYLDAAVAADRARRPALARTLRELAVIEIEHHEWFHARVRSHWLGRHLPLNPPLPRPTLA